jgi:hypothetical protein
MHKTIFKSPNDLTFDWIRVFDDLYENSLLLKSLISIKLEFDNGRLWEIDIDSTDDHACEKIKFVFHEYKKEIIKLDLSINVKSLKETI